MEDCHFLFVFVTVCLHVEDKALVFYTFSLRVDSSVFLLARNLCLWICARVEEIGPAMLDDNNVSSECIALRLRSVFMSSFPPARVHIDNPVETALRQSPSHVIALYISRFVTNKLHFSVNIEPLLRVSAMIYRCL